MNDSDTFAELVRRLRAGDGQATEFDWPEIVAELGGTPSGRRKQLARAMDRVARELGLDESDHDGAA